MNDAGALLIGGDYRALGLARSLGRRGIPVWVAKADDVLAGSSRFTQRSVPWPAGSDAEQIDCLVTLAEDRGLKGWVLFPTHDRTADLVSRHHATLEKHYRLTTSPWERFSLAQDKRLAYTRAQSLGIDVPRTWYPESGAEVADLDLEYPVILKPASHAIDNPLSQVKVWRIDDRASLLTRYAEASPFLPPGQVMIQEIIPGDGSRQFSFAAACRDGEAVASVTVQRSRQIPMDFGRASTFVESMDLPDVVEPATRMIADIGLTGLVEVEFKRDPRDDRLKLLDVNARVWGWHSIGAAAGVDFPYLAWRIACGEPVEPIQGRAGVRWARLTTDLMASAPGLLAGRMPVGPYFRSLRRPLVGPIAAKDDPVPALLELPLLGARFVRRARARLEIMKKSSRAS